MVTGQKDIIGWFSNRRNNHTEFKGEKSEDSKATGQHV
jgi:hypothetical protein